MRLEYQRKALLELIDEILQEDGLRVFVAERGTHGFYTDREGGRVVSFDVTSGYMCVPSYSGAYQPHPTLGTGWRLQKGSKTYTELLQEFAPYSITNGCSVKYSTLGQYLNRYQGSSKFREIERGN